MDFLSKGRFILGVGTGAAAQEFSACGVPVKERGKRTTEYLDIVKRLLTEKKVTYKGEFFEFKDISIEPLPSISTEPPCDLRLVRNTRPSIKSR